MFRPQVSLDGLAEGRRKDRFRAIGRECRLPRRHPILECHGQTALNLIRKVLICHAMNPFSYYQDVTLDCHAHVEVRNTQLNFAPDMSCLIPEL